MDGIFFEFPLCSLAFVGNDKQKIDWIISYCLVEAANSIKCKNSPNSKKSYLNEAAKHLGVKIGSEYSSNQRHNELAGFICEFTNKHGKDSYCRIGKDLTFETRDGQFDFNQFRLLCAIQSIIGNKKKFVRITYDRIRYRMYGYRSKEIFERSNAQLNLLSDKQIKRIVEILQSKKFFSKFTYARRQIYYSTRLEDEELREAVKQSKIYWKKKQLQIVDDTFTDEIKSELGKLHLESATLKEKNRLVHGRLRLVKTN